MTVHFLELGLAMDGRDDSESRFILVNLIHARAQKTHSFRLIRSNIKLRHANCVMQVPRTPFGTLETHASQGPTLATGLIVFIKNVGAKGPISRAKLNQFKFDKLLIES